MTQRDGKNLARHIAALGVVNVASFDHDEKGQIFKEQSRPYIPFFEEAIIRHVHEFADMAFEDFARKPIVDQHPSQVEIFDEHVPMIVVVLASVVIDAI